jgi:endonuclease YncB( thermonuclease family)
MKLRWLIANLFLLVLFLGFGAPSSSFYGKVIEIVDGDTIGIVSLNRPVKVELMAIDAPEMTAARSKHSI